jgi:hypothetical protein
MSELIPSALERKQPAVFLSGPSFAKEVMQNRPTGVVAAAKDAKLAKTVQALFASPTMRVNTTTDVVRPRARVIPSRATQHWSRGVWMAHVCRGPPRLVSARGSA